MRQRASSFCRILWQGALRQYGHHNCRALRPILSTPATTNYIPSTLCSSLFFSPLDSTIPRSAYVCTARHKNTHSTTATATPTNIEDITAQPLPPPSFHTLSFAGKIDFIKSWATSELAFHHRNHTVVSDPKRNKREQRYSRKVPPTTTTLRFPFFLSFFLSSSLDWSCWFHCVTVR